MGSGWARRRRREIVRREASAGAGSYREVVDKLAQIVAFHEQQIREIQQILVARGLVQVKTETGIILPGRGPERGG